jgi:glucose/arabinose dehydrogenase
MVREFWRVNSTEAKAGRNYRLLCVQRLICVAVCLLSSGVLLGANAATLPTGFVETQIATGLSSPTAMDFAPDGRLFVCLQGGNLRVIKNGALLPTPFLTLTVDSSGERGLLGVAFDPNFATNNFIYVYYTGPGSPAHNRVSRFTAVGDVAAAGSEMVLLNLDSLSSATNHNGGAIHFGPDGKLYVAVGENANPANSQTLTNVLGKVLRINSDGSIPTDNPFFNTAGARKEIWALGLRNPFTFAFQPGTGRLFINDVGQSTWEEINDGIAGSNYGWSTCEGVCAPPNANFRDPLFQYGHGSSSTTGCAIVGGGFYNPSVAQFPASYIGKYFFADLCTGWIRLFDPSNDTAADFASGISNPADLKVAADGSLYYLSIGSAAVFRIQYSPALPGITTQPSSQTVTAGQPATFMVSATGSTPLSYQWQRNQVNISGANASSYMIASATLADNGARFRCVVSNAFGNATSNEATLTVNAPPNINTNPADQTVTQGQPATFMVAASGSTPLSYQWQRNQINISGATASSYMIASTALPDNGAKFRCVVSNAFGSATSNEATLTVTAPPSITSQPSNQTAAQGQPATFMVAATGSTPLSYQWQRNQVNISGANASSYMIASTALPDNGAKFRCVVTNAFGNATSNEAMLTVTAPPSITTQPSDLTVTQGQPATFMVAASGSTPLSYQWQRNQVNISGANASSYMIASAALADNGAKFRCVVTNAFGNANSNEATLTVQPPPPILLTEDGTDSAIAFDSVTMMRDPFPLANVFNFGSDNRTRVMLFSVNLDLLQGENSSAVTARAEDALLNVYPLTAEFVGPVPNLAGVTELLVKLPDNLPAGQDVLVSITLHSRTSNKVRIRIK